MAAPTTDQEHATSQPRSGMRVGFRVVIGLLAGSALLMACNGGTVARQTDGSTSTSPETTTGESGTTVGTTVGTTPGTTPPVTPSPEAVAATLTAEDLGNDWRIYPETAEVIGKGTVDPCKDGPGVEFDPTMFSRGDILQKGDRSVYIAPAAWVFPDAASAEAHLRYRMSPEFAECRRAKLEQDLAEMEPKITIAMTGIEPSDGSTAYKGQVMFELRTEIDGVPTPTGISRHLLYLSGTTVIDLFDQSAGLADDPPDLSQQVNDETIAAMDLVLARVAG